MNPVLHKLAGRDRRSIGRSNEVVADVLRHPSRFASLFAGMLSDDPLIRMRAADAVEKISATHPRYLFPYKKKLMNQVARTGQQEVRWHVAQMIPRLNLNPRERTQAVKILLEYLQDRSSIVRTFAMQALGDLAGEDGTLQKRIVPLLRKLTATGTPAMKSRGRKLWKRLQHSKAAI
jgi:HEAT repeat protein